MCGSCSATTPSTITPQTTAHSTIEGNRLAARRALLPPPARRDKYAPMAPKIGWGKTQRRYDGTGKPECAHGARKGTLSRCKSAIQLMEATSTVSPGNQKFLVLSFIQSASSPAPRIVAGGYRLVESHEFSGPRSRHKPAPAKNRVARGVLRQAGLWPAAPPMRRDPQRTR